MDSKLMEYRKVIEREGAKVEKAVKHRHFKIRCRYGGTTFTVTASSSPSDCRDLKNFRAKVRRLVRKTVGSPFRDHRLSIGKD